MLLIQSNCVRMAAMVQERILDIGIGMGGKYIERDTPGVLRVGFDNDDCSQRLLVDDHPRVTRCLGTAETTKENGLPFATQAFKKIEIYFPINELLWALSSSDSGLWLEMKRILKSGGQIHLVMDESCFHQQGIFVHDKPTVLDYPYYKVFDVAKDAGFKVNSQQPSSDELREIGTQFSQLMAAELEGWGFRPRVYSLTARK